MCSLSYRDLLIIYSHFLISQVCALCVFDRCHPGCLVDARLNRTNRASERETLSSLFQVVCEKEKDNVYMSTRQVEHGRIKENGSSSCHGERERDITRKKGNERKSGKVNGCGSRMCKNSRSDQRRE